jgi:hypothetical protein
VLGFLNVEALAFGKTGSGAVSSMQVSGVKAWWQLTYVVILIFLLVISNLSCLFFFNFPV